MNENSSAQQPNMDMRTPLPLKILKLGLVLFFLLAISSTLYGGWWFVVATQFEEQVDAWISHQKNQGLEFTFERRLQRGFPGTIELKIENPKGLHQGGARGQWSGEQITLAIKPWALNQISFDAGGDFIWQYLQAGVPHRLTGTANRFQGEVRLDNGRVQSISTRIAELETVDATLHQTFKVAEGEVSLYDLKTAEPTFKIRLREIELPEQIEAPLGDTVKHFDAKGTVTGEVGLLGWPQILMRWRDQGGTVDFKSIDLDYPPLRMRGNGTLALDAQMQPIAALSVKAEGFFETIDALYERGLMPLGASFASKVALGVLSVKPEDGGDAYLDLPVTVQDRVLYAGTFKLLQLRPIRW